MRELEARLRALGGELEFPATPDIASAVRERLAEEEPARGRARPPRLPLRRSLVLAVLALLLLAGGVLAAAPGVRDAVLELLGLEGATVEVRSEPPATRPAPGPLDLGASVGLAAAQREAGFDVLVPGLLGAPDSTHLRRPPPPGGEVSLVYGRGPEVLVSEFQGSLDPNYIGKIVGGGSDTERVRVDGGPGIWVGGEPHLLFYRDASGRTIDSSLRLAQNALLFERDGLLVRIEGELPKGRALAIAESLR